MCLTVEQIDAMLARGDDMFSFGEPLPACRLALTPAQSLCRGLARRELGAVGEGRIAAKAEAIYAERRVEIDAAVAEAAAWADEAVADLRNLRVVILLSREAANDDAAGETLGGE